MGLRIREALGVRKADFKERPDGTRYLHLCWQASGNGTELEPLKHRNAGDFRDIPVPDMVWNMAQSLPDGPLCPGPKATPYFPYPTAVARFATITGHLGISGAHTHSLRHQFATEALDTDPRELANISQVLGHDNVQTTLRFYIHASANAEQRIGAMINARWTAPACPGREGTAQAHGQPRPRRAGQPNGDRRPDQNPRAAAGDGGSTRTRPAPRSRPGPAGTAPNGPGRKAPLPPSRKPPPAAASTSGRTRAESRRGNSTSTAGLKALRAHSLSGGKPHSPFPPGPPSPPEVAALPGKPTP